MGYRRKSKETAIFESITGLAAVVLFLLFFSQEFRHFAQILLAFLVIGCFTVLLIRMAFMPIKPKSSSSVLETSEPKSNHADDSTNYWPPTIREESQYVPHAPELTISEKLRKIDWFQFEKLIQVIYLHRGFTVKRLGGASADGGIDLIIESSTEKFVVQCKHWRKWTVGVRHIREFLGTLTDSKIPKGIFITLEGYSGDAKQLAVKHGIQILDKPDIIVMLVESGLIYSKEISALFSDERKFCPKCEKEMVLRTSRLKGNQFWGCSNYPHCRFTLNFEA
jgi:Restriction endonuclease/Topoisomerase DNA binding C4 zinc finger